MGASERGDGIDQRIHLALGAVVVDGCADHRPEPAALETEPVIGHIRHRDVDPSRTERGLDGARVLPGHRERDDPGTSGARVVDGHAPRRGQAGPHPVRQGDDAGLDGIETPAERVVHRDPEPELGRVIRLPVLEAPAPPSSR